MRATAQPGIVYPAGNRAGVLLSYYSLDPVFFESEYTGLLRVRTYLDNVMQETILTTPTAADLLNGDAKLHAVFRGGLTTKPFNAVEFVFNRDLVGTYTYLFAYEFCSDGHS